MSRTAGLGDRRFNRIGLGTNRLTNTPENHDFLRAAVEVGVGLIDSAHLYTGGESEMAIGAALAPFPDDLVVATKGAYYPGSGRPERLRAELEESLERLRTDSIALYYLHRVDPEVPLEESLSVLREFRDAGRIGHVGVSQVTVDQIERARTVVPIAAVQNEYNLSERKYEDVVDFCERENILFVPFFPLRGSHACFARRDRETVRRNPAADHARVAPKALTDHRPDPGDSLVRAFEAEPGRARPRADERRLRQAGRRGNRLKQAGGGIKLRGNSPFRGSASVRSFGQAMPSYLIECYLPLSRRRELSATATRVRRAADAVAAEGAQIRYVGSTFLPGDELCLHLLEAESAEAVSRVSGHARIAFDRVVEAIPVESSKDPGGPACLHGRP